MTTITPNISNIHVQNQSNLQQVKRPQVQSADVVKISEKTNLLTAPQKMLLSLAKSGLTGEKVDTSLFEGRTKNDWIKMYNMGQDNAITPFALEGLRNNPDIKIPDEVRAGMEKTEEYARKNHIRQEKILGKLTKFAQSKGIDVVQMKGIGFSMNYPKPYQRFGGDIDIYNFKHGTNPADVENNTSLQLDAELEKKGIKIDHTHGEKHSNLRINGMPIENHLHILNIEDNTVIHKKMNDYLLKHINPVEQILPNGTKVLVPSKEFNTIFIPFHAMSHFVHGNPNIHHLTDWAMHIKKNGLKLPDEVKGTKFETFIYAFTNLANKHFGTNVKVPENKQLEDAILHQMFNQEVLPDTKNPIKNFVARYKRFMNKTTRRNEFLEADPHYFAKALKAAIKYKLEQPAGILKLFTNKF